MPKHGLPIERFYRSVIRGPGCWLWQLALNAKGYGVFALSHRKRVFAHRFSYEMHVGPAGELVVCHSCDVPQCCNPEHLFLGTTADNMADMCRKGRKPSKLSPGQVLEIRARHATGESMYSLAPVYGVNRSTIRNICNGKKWKTMPASQARRAVRETNT